MALAPTSVIWGSLTLDDSQTGDYHLTNIAGWEGLPDPRADDIGRPEAHGTFDGPVWSGSRTVHIEGECRDQTTRDALLSNLGAAFGFAGSGPAQDLTITLGGKTLTAGAKVLRYSPAIARGDWGTGWFGWQVDFRCADPLRYGPERTFTTKQPTPGGGMVFPPGPVFDFGTPGSTGTVTVTNDGSAPAPLILRIDGSASGGFVLTENTGGSRLRFPPAVFAGSWITINTATGRVTINDQADRRGSLIAPQFGGFIVPAKGSLPIHFDGDSGTDSNALLTVTVRSANW